jgi:hypothetical protein
VRNENQKPTSKEYLNNFDDIFKVYRCSQCGTPCDKYGYPIDVDMTIAMQMRYDNAKLVYGDCCIEESDNILDTIEKAVKNTEK